MPHIMPKLRLRLRLNPRFWPDAIAMIVFGPGVSDIVKVKTRNASVRGLLGKR
jgi:hypothetical protein